MQQTQQIDGGSVRLLACGLDTVVANILPIDEAGEVIQAPLAEELQAELNSYKEQAQAEEEAVPTRWVFAGSNLFMKDKAGAPFKWILEHPKLKVSISRGLRVPLVGQVRLSSEYLWEWQHNLERAFSDVWLFLTSIFGDAIFLQAAGADLAKDVVGWDVGVCNVKDDFIYRATSDDTIPGGFNEDGMIDGPDGIKRRWRRITGLPFGKHTSAVSCLIYDKTHEIKYHSPEKRWLHDLWRRVLDRDGQPLWQDEQPVWRVEFRFKRKALHEFGIESVWDLLKHLGDLWAYAAGHVGGDADGLPDGWLRYVVPVADTNRSRWPVHPVWEVVQAPFAPVGLAPAVTGGAALAAPVPVLAPLGSFIRTRKYEVNMQRAVAAFAGYASTAEAFRLVDYERLGIVREAEPDISDTFHFLFNEVQAYLEEKSKKRKDADFASVVRKKRAVYHLAAVAVA